jgi:hypothetical protein
MLIRIARQVLHSLKADDLQRVCCRNAPETDMTLQTIHEWFTVDGLEYHVEADIAWSWTANGLDWQIDCWTSEPDPPTSVVEDQLHEQLCEYMDSEFSP